jgi:spermidine synthase
MLGTLWSQRILIAVAAVGALLVLLARLRGGAFAAARGLPAAAALAAAIAAPVVAVVLAYGIPSAPNELYAFGRTIMNPLYPPTMLYVGEGRNSSVAVSEDSEKTRYFHVAGKTEASSHPVDMRLQRMLASLSALLAQRPRSVLVVGFGAGITAGTFLGYSGIERIVICEIEPLIPQDVSGYFSEQNFDVVKSPRAEVVYDDARRFVLTSKEKFDIITSDPIHPWVKGSASLYTREYFEHVKRHLNPGGVVTHWVPIDETTLGR